ncbi:unnamed protein product [Peronospora belbahrii]|uniref:RING-type E3 ubiquitin transferase BRCA1 n=1 Tax=Peronospora belbahrii TaxID=622444 RepID=A0AAU9KLA0_9STRA|nr:unnamed protein product [Peronospora belbahrii]CAH0515184.1 unnamed protein product [Peronospora belbahrii]
MALLSSSRLEAIRLIREQLLCLLCGNIFQDPQCLDCKHNFCHPCILLHLKKSNSYCPYCQLPTRPSEVTRNQFLESILAAWKGVETELEALNGDPALHAAKYTVEDTDRAFCRAGNGSDAVAMSEDRQGEERHGTRGRVANHKWHIDTQEIRHELKLEQPYLSQHYGSRCTGNKACWKKTSSDDLPDDYGGSANGRKEEKSNGRRSKVTRKSEEKMSVVSLDQASAVDREEVTRWIQGGEEENTETTCGFVSSSAHSLMATQEVESYMDRITKQREALSQWERSLHEKSDGKLSLLDLERSLHSSKDFDKLLKERRRESQRYDDDDFLLTQMSPYTSALESPDLLASFRRRHHPDHFEGDNDRRPVVKAKRRVLPSSSPSLHSQGQVSSPIRKKLRMPTHQNDPAAYSGNSTSSIDQVISDKDNENEIPDSQPATIQLDEAHREIDDEEEYETKPALPLPQTPGHKTPPSDQHCERLRDLFLRKQDLVSNDFQSVVTAFVSEHKNDSCSPKTQAARQLIYSASKTKPAAGGVAAKCDSKTTRPSFSEMLSEPPVHTLTSNPRPLKGGSNFVFVSSDLTREKVKRVLEATQRLGGKFGHDFDLKRDPVTGHFYTSVTHLITRAVPPIGAISGAEPEELRCKRTAKYMRALAEGSFVMDFSWISASLAAGRWLTEEPFEIIGDIYSDAIGKPHEGRIRRVQTGRRNSIFSMFSFVLLVSENEFDFQFNSVKNLVNNFGGTVVHVENFFNQKKKKRSRRTSVGVVSKSTLPSDAKAKWQQFQIPIVRITWIFDSVSHLEVLPFDDYYPY